MTDLTESVPSSGSWAVLRGPGHA